MAHEYPVVVLAAGASRRMGRPKALLEFDGRSAIGLVVSACREAGCGPIHVVLGDGAEALRASVAREEDVEIVINPDHERGQTCSVKAGLRALRGEAAGFLIFPADHPLVEAADILALRAAFEAQDPREGALPVHGGRRGHPVLLAGRHREGILSLPDETPLHDYIRPRLPALAQVEVGNPWVVAAMNTPGEYAMAREAHRRRRERSGREETR